MTEAHRWGRQAVSREFCPSAWLGCATRGLLGQQDLRFLPEEAGFVLWGRGKILDVLRGQRVDVRVSRHPVLGRKNKLWEGFEGAESSDDKAHVF